MTPASYGPDRQRPPTSLRVQPVFGDRAQFRALYPCLVAACFNSVCDRVFAALVGTLITRPNVTQRFNGGHHAGLIGFGRCCCNDHFGHGCGSSGESTATGAGSGYELDRLLHRRQWRLQLGSLQPRPELLQSSQRRNSRDRHRRRPRSERRRVRGQLGYNWQTANWVFGIETDAQWTGQVGRTTVLCPVAGCFPALTAVPAGVRTAAALNDKLEWFGTFRGRGGVLVTPSVLLYVTGGLAYGSVQTDLDLSGFTATGIPVTVGATRSSDKFGWTIGGGVESMFAANWSAKIEYLYVDLGSISNSVVLPTAAGFPLGANVTSRVTDSVIRGGISYHFSDRATTDRLRQRTKYKKPRRRGFFVFEAPEARLR